jgi:hypothetical protein
MATSPDPIALAHAAASAIERLCCTLDDCAREVEGRGGERTARAQRDVDTAAATMALGSLYAAIGQLGTRRANAPCAELIEMVEGCRYGYVRPAWAIRVVQLATEVCGG